MRISRISVAIIFLLVLLLHQFPYAKAEMENSSEFRDRLCTRVVNRFSAIPRMWERVNKRILRRFGYTCEANQTNTSSSASSSSASSQPYSPSDANVQERCEAEGGNYLVFTQINWARCDCPDASMFDEQSGTCLTRMEKCLADNGQWLRGSDACWDYDMEQCREKGCKGVITSYNESHCEPTNYCECPEGTKFGNSGCVDPGHPSIIGVPKYMELHQMR